MLHFTTAQLLIIYGWCEEAEHETGLKAREAEQARRYEDAALLIEQVVRHEEIRATIAAELKVRGTRPLTRRPRI